jgi:hypothetical protein
MNTHENIIPGQRFPLGSLYLTRGVEQLLQLDEVLAAVCRHAAGDWGDLDPDDRDMNERALENGSRLLSRYHASGRPFWVITEADRESTTVLLPAEY